MARICWHVVLLAALLALPALPRDARSESPMVTLSAEGERWRGDLDGMIERRAIRVLVPYSMTLYFFDVGGNQRGISYELMRAFDEALNKKLKTGTLRINFQFIPMARDKLIPALLEGRGDIVAANLTVTPERQALVDFTAPLAQGIKELVITGADGPDLKSMDDLAGQRVFVRTTTSYYESLQALNADFRARSLPPMILEPAPHNFEVEDVLEMADAGLVKIVIADHYLANFWRQVFPEIKVHEDLAIREEGEIAFAIRKNSPLLKAELDPFIEKNRAGTTVGNILLKKYLKSLKWVKNAASAEEREKFRKLAALFVQYGKQYGIDWLLMAAQGYQESRLDHSKRSKMGAIGVMQVMPATGKELGVGDIREVEANIHAGIKYIRFMIDQHYADEAMDNENKVLFAFAAYNAGPGRISSFRREALKRGLDPNLWFDNVEFVAADRIGRETVQYVRNIYKYYIAYKLILAQMEERRDAVLP